MSYLLISTQYRRILALGLLLNFFAGYGQSFLISLFTPSVMALHGLDHAEFGFIYAAVTLASGFFLPWLGGMLDQAAPRTYAWGVVGSLAISCFVFAYSGSVYWVALGLFGLRLCGQTLMSHISATVVARSFLRFRGRALSLITLGHPIGEAVLPALSVTLIQAVGWQRTWAVFGAVLLFGFAPWISYLLKGDREVSESGTIDGAADSTRSSPPLAPRVWLKSPFFWFLAFGSMLPAFFLTALFLYHGVLGELRGWTLTSIASSFLAFAAARVLSSLVGGPWVDRLSARRLFPYHLIPLGVAIGLLGFVAQGAWILPAYLFLSGITVGFGGPMKVSLWAEIYGVDQLARVRGTTGALVVAATAAGAPILGLALDAGVSFEMILRASTLLILTYVVICLAMPFFRARAVPL